MQRLLEVVVGDLQVVFGGNGLRITDPRTDNMERIPLGQLCLSRSAQVLEQFGPRLQTRTADNSVQCGPEVLGGTTIPGNNELGALVGGLKHFPQIRKQLRKDGYLSRLASQMVLGLGTVDSNTLPVPINVRPA